MPVNYITLTRQSLYELAWSKPMSSLAKEFGISDVALAKRCRAVNVPIPYRGYWARKAAGQEPPRTPLSKYRRTEHANGQEIPPAKEIMHDGQEPSFCMEKRPPRAEPPTPTQTPEHAAFTARLEARRPKVRSDLRDAHPAIQRTALQLKAQRLKDLEFSRGERSGPIVRVHVDSHSINRALRVADGVLRAAEGLGWPFKAPPKEGNDRSRYDYGYQPPEWGCIAVHGELVLITVTERRKQVPHVLTKSERDDQARGYRLHLSPWDLAPTGDLRLNLATPDGHVFETFADKARRRLEERLSDVLHALLERALTEKRWREERRRAEEAQRERERQEALARERRQAQSKLVAELERQAGAWYRANILRRYVRAARRQIGAHIVTAPLQDEAVDFLEWASAYIEQLDPLSRVPPHPDQTPRHSTYGSEDAALKGALLRLIAHDGSIPRKIGLQAGNSQTVTDLEDDDDDGTED